MAKSVSIKKQVKQMREKYVERPQPKLQGTEDLLDALNYYTNHQNGRKR